MGAGYCQWGGLTDRKICNIYREAHLAINPMNVINPINLPRPALGPSAAAGEAKTHGRKARKYI